MLQVVIYSYPSAIFRVKERVKMHSLFHIRKIKSNNDCLGVKLMG